MPLNSNVWRHRIDPEHRARVGTPSLAADGEPQIDLVRWRDAVLLRPWLVAVGLVVGLVVGGLYSLTGGKTYSATLTIQPAQPFNPSGSAVLAYSSSPLAIQVLVDSVSGLAYAATAAHIEISQLKGHVNIGSVYTGTGSVATRGTVLIQVTVTLPDQQQTESAANALGAFVRNQTEGPYVRRALAVFAELNRSYTKRLATVNVLISTYQAALAKAKLLDPIDSLVLASELNNQIAIEGQLETEQLSNRQSWTLAQNTEVAQIINPAVAVKAMPPSRRNSLVFGALIGLLVGALVALVVGLRPVRPASS